MELPTLKTIVLRCYAVKRDGEFYAECVDLDISVTRPTLQEAIKALNDAVMGHVVVAVEHGCVSELVPRPSPLLHRLYYRFLILATKVLSLIKTDAAVFDQVVPCAS